MKRNIIGLLLILMAVGIGFGLLLPQINSVRAITVEKNARLQVIANKETRRDALRTLSGTFANQQGKVTSIISTLPQEPEIPQVLLMVESIANDSNLTFTTLVPQVDTRTQEVSLTVSGQGDLQSIEHFIDSIGKNSRPMSVSNVSLTKRDDGRLAYSLGLVIPYISNSTASPAPEASPATGQ